MKERPTEPHKERGPCVTGSGSDMTQKCPGVFDGSENINTFFLLLLFLKKKKKHTNIPSYRYRV